MRRMTLWFLVWIPLHAQVITIPDPNLHQALVTGYWQGHPSGSFPIDINADGMITAEEARRVTGNLDLSGLGIQDLSGLEWFVEAKTLYLRDNPIRQATFSDMNLSALLLERCQLEEISLTRLPRLASLWLSDNPLNIDSCTIDVPSLEYLNMDRTGLDAFSPFDYGLNNLTGLSLVGNSLREFSVSGLHDLYLLSLCQNPLSRVDIGEVPHLGTLTLCETLLTSLEGIDAPALMFLLVDDSQIHTLDLRRFPGLRDARASNNPITLVHLGKHDNLRLLLLRETALTDLTLSGLPKLGRLEVSVPKGGLDLSIVDTPLLYWIDASGLSGFRVAESPGLREIRIGVSDLPALQLTDLPDLEKLYVRSSNIGTFSFANLPRLRYVRLWDLAPFSAIHMVGPQPIQTLYATGCRLTALDLADLTALEFLDLSNNQIQQQPDLELPGSLKTLHLENNELVEFSVPPGLEVLYLSSNRLQALELHDDLKTLDAHDNDLRVLDIEFENLEALWITNNPLINLDFSSKPDLRGLSVGPTTIPLYDLSQNSGLEVLSLVGEGPEKVNFGAVSPLTVLVISSIGRDVLDIPHLANLSSISISRSRIESVNLPAIETLTYLGVYRNAMSNLTWLRTSPWLGIGENQVVDANFNLLDEGDCPDILAIQDKGVDISYTDQGLVQARPSWFEWPAMDIRIYVSGRFVERYTLTCE